VEYGGSSLILGPAGKIIAKAGNKGDEIITGEIDLDDIEKERQEKPVFNCRREDLY